MSAETLMEPADQLQMLETKMALAEQRIEAMAKELQKLEFIQEWLSDLSHEIADLKGCVKLLEPTEAQKANLE